MSAWPEAVWLKNEVNKALNVEAKVAVLSERLDVVEKRRMYISTDQPANISAGSVWAHVIED